MNVGWIDLPLVPKLRGFDVLTDQLRYFVAAANHEHLGRAAEQLDLSQPALSRSIQKLEEELGLPLFDRVGRGVRLNEAGKILLRRVNRARAEFEDALRELQDYGGTKIVSIGYFSTFGVRLIPELVRGFSTLEPNLQFKLFEAPSPLLAKQLLTGEIDLCISTELLDSALEWRPLFKEELFALVPNKHRFAGRKSIELIELADEPFVALRAGHGLRVVLDDLCQQAGFRPNISLEGYEVGSLRGLVASGFGVTLAPKRSISAGTYIDVPISSPPCYRTIGVSWRKERWLSPKALAFKDYLIREMTSINLGRDQQSTQAEPRTFRKPEVKIASQAATVRHIGAGKSVMRSVR
jgi:DNA-binding transcriptional LysR family regulator